MTSSPPFQDGPVSLESILRTDELNRRASRPPDYATENRALVGLAQALADSPRTILQKLADTMLEVFQSDSAGISLLTKDDGGKRFYWPAIAGVWKPHIGGGTPRDFGPCGDVLDRDIPLLFSHFERRYTYFLPVTPPVEECLLVPFYVEGKAVGTIWAIAHDDRRKFDAEDLRQLTSLGRFASSAYQVVESLNALDQDDMTLRESERRFREMIDALPAAIYTTDAEGRVTHFNPAAVEISGRVPKLGTDQWCVSWKLFNPDGTPMPHDKCPMAISLKEGRAIRGAEIIAERPDGTRRWFEPFPTPLYDSKGRVVGGINMLVDITQRKGADEAYSRLAAIVESSDDAIISKNLNGIITSWNKSAERLFGYTEEEVVGQPITILIPADRLDEEPVILERLKRGERIDHFDSVRVRKDGTRIAVSLTVSPVRDVAGRIIAASKIVRDITDRKRAEEALAEADRRKDEFLATLAHELRNPLNPIRNAVESLRIKGPPDAELQLERDVIDRQVQHLTRLIDDLLDINRITRDTLELRKQAVELAEIAQLAIEMSRPLIDQAGHELSVTLPDEPVWLDGDPARLSQVLMNLLNNAAKYTEPGGQIWLDATRENEQVVIAVTDTGIGIPPEKLDNLFEIFYQADRSLERSQSGLGIGLSLVRRFVEMHGGTVTAHSEGLGMGSRFVVRLPVLVGAPPPAKAARDDGPKKSDVSRRILVVDDNQDSAKMLAAVLRLVGNEVEMAFDGLEALQTVERFRPQIVLLDIGMPRLNGYETCRRIREQPWGKDVLLIAQTGWGQNEDRRRTDEAGFDAHLVKPVGLADLNALFEQCRPARA